MLPFVIDAKKPKRKATKNQREREREKGQEQRERETRRDARESVAASKEIVISGQIVSEKLFNIFFKLPS